MLVPVNACRVPAKKGPGDAPRVTPRPLDYVPASQTLTDSKVLRLSDENVCVKVSRFSSKFRVMIFKTVRKNRLDEQ